MVQPRVTYPAFVPRKKQSGRILQGFRPGLEPTATGALWGPICVSTNAFLFWSFLEFFGVLTRRVLRKSSSYMSSYMYLPCQGERRTRLVANAPQETSRVANNCSHLHLRIFQARALSRASACLRPLGGLSHKRAQANRKLKVAIDLEM